MLSQEQRRNIEIENARVVQRSPIDKVYVYTRGNVLGPFMLHHRPTGSIAWFWGRWHPMSYSAHYDSYTGTVHAR